MEQRRPAHDRPVGCLVDDLQRVLEHVLMVVDILAHAAHLEDVGDDVRHQAEVAEQAQGVAGPLGDQDLGQLLGDALATDPGEQTDLTAQQPEKAQALQTLFDTWNATMQPPRWEDRRWNGEENRKANKPAKTKKKTQ